MRYVPGASCGKTNRPDLSDVPAVTELSAVVVSGISALGTNAPDGSVMAPRTEVELVCARSGTTAMRNTNSVSLSNRMRTASKKDDCVQSSRRFLLCCDGACRFQPDPGPDKSLSKRGKVFE